MSALWQRTLAAAVFAPLMWLLVWLGGWPLELAVLAAAAGMLREVLPMLQLSARSPLGMAAAAGTLLCTVGIYGYLPFVVGGPALLAALVMVPLTIGLAERASPQQIAQKVGQAILATLWCGATLACLVCLRRQSDGGRALALTVLGATWAQDTGAYFVGRALGRRKLAPRWSPNKTVEGAAGGLWAAVAAALLARAWLGLQLSVQAAAGLGMLCAVTGTLGDLCESMLKRAAGVKDSSQLIPGHGGLFDRMDALLFSAPAALAWVTWRAAAQQ